VSQLLTFPDPVDEVSARMVAFGALSLAITTVVLDQPWLTLVLAYGFVARVLTGPKLSPLGLLVTRVVRPRLTHIEPRPVPGPPKRFAQGIGAVLTVSASVVWFAVGSLVAVNALLGVLVVAATLESVFGFCLGCRAFGALMRIGVIPERTCEACVNFTPA
jgi:hypothetical protein